MTSPLRRLGLACALLLAGCTPIRLLPQSGEGESCEESACAEGLACVPDVGGDYGIEASTDVCELPRAVYGFLHFGEPGEIARVDAAMDMIEGVYRLPRMSDSDPSLATKPHPQQLRDGSSVGCLGFAPGAVEHECEAPDWRAYLGNELSVYNQYILFGLRMTGELLFTALHASDDRLRERLEARTGHGASRSALARLRLDARNAGLAVFDSFMSEGHLPYALEQLPTCEAPGSGYPNPNRSWSPSLAQWDPGSTIDGLGRVVPAAEGSTPVECAGPSRWSYTQLRLSLWDPHATAYRAQVLADAYQMFRGILSIESRNAWLTAIRQTGDALALPSGYEPGNNHGISESIALLQLAHDFARTDRVRLPRELTDAWLRLGRHRLNDLLVDTVFPDGVQIEQSPFYHDYQLNLLLDATSWLARAGIDLTEDIDSRYGSDPDAVPPAQRLDFDAEHPQLASPDLNRLNPSTALDVPGLIDGMVRAAIHVGLPSGWIPMIGSSLPQRFSGYAEPEFEGYERQERPFSEQLRYYRSGGVEGAPPGDEELLTVFENSGFVTLHSAFAPNFTQQTHIVFNAGVPFHRHSHPDALSVHLFGPDPGTPGGPGIPLLVDSGWFSYTAEGRHYFESTSAHNTVNVDGDNQCARDALRKRANPYIDAPLVSCEKLAAAARSSSEPALAPPGEVQLGLTARGVYGSDSWLYASALHGLYSGVAHRRGLLLLGRDVLLVLDDLSSREPHAFSLTWHLAPDVPALVPAGAGDGGVHIIAPRSAADSTPLLSLHAASNTAAELQLHYGEPDVAGVPGQGWYSTAEDQLQPAAVVELSQRAQLRAVFASLFLLGARAGQGAQLGLTESGVGQLTLELDIEGIPLHVAVQNLGSGAASERITLE